MEGDRLMSGEKTCAEMGVVTNSRVGEKMGLKDGGIYRKCVTEHVCVWVWEEGVWIYWHKDDKRCRGSLC